jgi:hypothetical protein
VELTKETLQERLNDVEARFNTAKVRKEQAEVALEDASNECLRIQGEYRAVNELVELSATSPKPSVEVKDEGKHGRK